MNHCFVCRSSGSNKPCPQEEPARPMRVPKRDGVLDRRTRLENFLRLACFRSMDRAISNSQLAYYGLRFGFGVPFLVHGAVRFPKLNDFANGLAGQFEGTLIGGFPALGFAYMIPFAEVLIALAILRGGAFIRWGAFAGCLLMGGIMFGTCFLEKWDLLASQLIHLALFYAILLNPNTPENPKV